MRTVLFTVSLVLLASGYAASQIAYFEGSYTEYATRVDCQPVRTLALLLLACCVVVPWLGKPSEASGS